MIYYLIKKFGNMSIYKIESDYNYKNISSNDEFSINQFKDFKGQSLKKEWVTPKFSLLEEVTKLEKEKKNEISKITNFDARCYGNILFIKSKFESLFEKLNIELLPIFLFDKEWSFSFINVLEKVEAINFEGLDYKESMEMMKSNKIRFNKNNIGNSILFRDAKLSTFYYCTDNFRSLIENNNITGLSFEKVGEAI